MNRDLLEADLALRLLARNHSGLPVSRSEVPKPRDQHGQWLGASL